MSALKPNEEIMAASFAVSAVFTIFSTTTPNRSDVAAANPGNSNVHSSIKTAVITSAAVISAIALLAKSPTVYVVGGLAVAAEGWSYYHANAYDPAKKQVTTQQQAPGSAGS